MEWDVVFKPTPLVYNGATPVPDLQIIAPWDDAVKYYAAFLAIASLQTYEQAMFWSTGDWMPGKQGRYEKRILAFPRQTITRRIYDPYRTYRAMMQRIGMSS